MLSLQRISNNLAFASRSLMRSAYASQIQTSPPTDHKQKLPTDRIVPDINVDGAPSIDDPLGRTNEPPPYETRESDSADIDANRSDRIENRYSTKRAPDDIVDATELFQDSPSSAGKLRGGQSQIGQVPNASESFSAQEASSVDSNEPSGLKETAKQYMADIKDKVGDIKENVKEKANDYSETVSEKASAAKQKQDEWLNKSSDRYEDFKQEAKEKTNDSIEKIKEMPHIIKEKVKDITGIGKRH